MQRIDADDRRAARRGELDQRAQIAEVADAPVALGAHAVELHHEAPHASALREQLRLMATAGLEPDLRRLARRSQRPRERLARGGVDALLVAPDVEVTLSHLRIPGQGRNYSNGCAALLHELATIITTLAPNS